MSINARPKRAFIAYCVLAEKLNTPGIGVMQALIPFLAEACQHFAGEFFDAEKFSYAVAEQYGIRIPRLAALGLAEQLAQEGLLTVHSQSASSVIYQYVKAPALAEAAQSSPVTEAEVEAVLASFVSYCKSDTRLSARDEQSLQSAFLDRLLNVDSMRILSRREASIAAKKSADTLLLNKPTDLGEYQDSEELHLDFLVSQFLIDLRDNDAAAFEQVSNVAFANMAAEAIACFQEPPSESSSLSTLTVYLDSPLLLDMLGVNTEYTLYGRELLDAIKASGAIPAAFDHCIAEAEAAIHAQLTYLRSGFNQLSANWGIAARPELLSALVGNVAERAENRLGITLHRDPDVQLHRRSQATVGDIETEMNNRMQAWRNTEAKEYDRKSVWAMLAIRDSTQPCFRICDSKCLLLTRNTPLVRIANDAWNTWLKGSTRHSHTHIERWTPVAMADKQFAGYLWARTGCGNGSISRARLLAHCSAAVRPRADVKARAYNLVLELNGREEADDLAALLEDREGAKALMRATKGDPEDVTRERLPFILEQVKLAAGEFAAAKVREESKQQLEEERLAHNQELELARKEVTAAQMAQDTHAREAQAELLQKQQEQQHLESQNIALRRTLAEQSASNARRENKILQDGLAAGVTFYRQCRWAVALSFAAASGITALISTEEPVIATCLTVFLGLTGFWFVPDFLDKPLSWCSMKRLRSVISAKDASILIPTQPPDFKSGYWAAVNDRNN